jgi:small-conductance mechanosensitive channel
MQTIIEDVITIGMSLLPFIILCIFVVLVLSLLHKLLLGNKTLSMSQKFPRQLILLLVYVVSIVTLVISLPIDPSIRNQVLALIGILLSGVIAFSSTNIVANLMAGIVMRITNPFRTGDFIKVQEHSGRVTQKGLFDTEVQTEHRELIHLTNSFMLSHPIKVVRSSGTIISANLSLGYELHHKRVEKLLIEAAKEIGLEEPFVQIIELGDFSVSYRISGLLTEVKSMISARSKLMSSVLDTLHGDNIEIVSPNFMNQRRMDDLPPIIAKAPSKKAEASQNEAKPEEIIFDKAEEAESREMQIQNLQEHITLLEQQIKSAQGEEKPKLQSQLLSKQQRLVILRQKDENEP